MNTLGDVLQGLKMERIKCVVFTFRSSHRKLQDKITLQSAFEAVEVRIFISMLVTLVRRAMLESLGEYVRRVEPRLEV